MSSNFRKLNSPSANRGSLSIPDGFPLKTLAEFDAFQANDEKQTELVSILIYFTIKNLSDENALLVNCNCSKVILFCGEERI